MFASIGTVVTWLRSDPTLETPLERISTQYSREDWVRVATRIIWKQVALGGSEVFVFKLQQDNFWGFMHKVELA